MLVLSTRAVTVDGFVPGCQILHGEAKGSNSTPQKMSAVNYRTNMRFLIMLLEETRTHYEDI